MQPARLEKLFDTVDVPLRVDDDGGLAVVGDVAAVAQFRGLDDLDFDHGTVSLPSSFHGNRRRSANMPGAGTGSARGW
jgi:hypothetical protein